LRISDLGVLKDSELRPIDYGFDRWCENYRKRFVHLQKDNVHVFIKQFSRFDSGYKGILYKKLRLLNFMVWDLKIELTIDPKKFMLLSDEFVFITKGWNKLRSWLKRRYGNFEFLRVLEVQKSGRPHLHVLLSGIKWIDHAELSEIWQKYGGGEIVYIKNVYNREKLSTTGYVLKYVNKTLRQSDKRYSALLFASNKRVFGISKGCQNMIHVEKKEPQGFEYCSSVLESQLEGFCKRTGRRLGLYLLIEANLVFDCEGNMDLAEDVGG
jgi:hypothetical protein